MSSGVWLFAFFLFGFGAFAYGAVIAAAIRTWRMRRADPGEQPTAAGAPWLWAPDVVMAALSLVWFLVCLALLIAGLDPTVDANGLTLFKHLLAFAFPPAILYYHFYGWPHGPASPPDWSSRFQRGAVIVVGGIAAATVVVTAAAVAGVTPVAGDVVLRSSVSVLGILFFVAFMSGALFGRRPVRPGEEFKPVSIMTTRLLSLAAGLLATPLAVHVVNGWRLQDTPLLLFQSMPLFFLVATSYHEERFQFIDLLVKRGLAAALSLMALVGWFAIVLPAVGAFGPDWVRPWLLALAALPLMWALPVVRAAIGRIVDRHLLGRRYSVERGYAALVDDVLRAMQPAGTEAQLANEVSRAFSTFFNAPVTLRIGSEESDTPVERGGMRVPVVSGGERLGELHLGPRPQQAPWLSEDLVLVGILADVCGYQVVTTRLREREALQAQRAQALELLASRSRLQALRAQVNPHFLFNALNAIAGLIHRDPELADRTVERLAEVFRYTLRQSENEWAPFGAELAFVRAYLDVEQARFGGRLMITWDVEGAPAHAHVPALALQTLVENAVKHGVARARGPAAIVVAAWVEQGMLVIDVADTGAGFVPSTPMGRLPPAREGGRFGLRSLQERLAGYFGDRAALTWRREEGRTHVRLTLPLVEREAAS